MPGAEIIPEVVEITTTMIPALRAVPLVRGLVVALQSDAPMNELKASEAYEAEGKKRQEQRNKLKKKFNKHVIKISDALQCVENNVFNGKIAIAFAKALLSTITKGPAAQTTPDAMFDLIAKCMVEKRLQQKNKRSKGKYVKTKGPGLPGPESQPDYEELVRLRRGKLHPFIPKGTSTKNQ